MNNQLTSLSVVLPVFNEAEAIKQTLLTTDAFLLKEGFDYEIIAVNDGSTDKSADIIRNLNIHHPQIRLVEHQQNNGYGEALNTGFNNARKDWILLMDSDGQFKIESIKDLLPFVNTHQAIVGYRQNRADSLPRAICTWGYSSLINLIFNLNLKDIGCGFKLFRRSVWQGIQPIISKDHKIFTVEWMWRIRQNKIPIKQVPVQHYPRIGGKPTGARPDVIIDMIKALLALRFKTK